MREKVKKLETELYPYKRDERTLEYKMKELEQKMKRKALSDFLDEFKVSYYKIGSKHVLIDKCDKCNDSRKVPFISPLGKEMVESCTCNVSYLEYFPVEYICNSFRKKDNYGDEIIYWYKINPKDKHYDEYYSYDSSCQVKDIWEESMGFKDEKPRDLFFGTLEDCEKYCQHLNPIAKENILKPIVPKMKA